MGSGYRKVSDREGVREMNARELYKMEEHELHIKEFEKNQEWFTQNFDDILKKYRDKFVAVWNQKVIEADENLKILSIKIRKKTLNAKGVYVGYASDKPVEMIL